MILGPDPPGHDETSRRNKRAISVAEATEAARFIGRSLRSGPEPLSELVGSGLACPFGTT